MTIDKDGLASLLERVREAKGPDKVLDAAIWEWEGTDLSDVVRIDGARAHVTTTVDGLVTTNVYKVAPEYTASIDASLALVERVAGGEGEQPLVYNFELGWHASAHDHMAYTADLFVADGDPAVMLSYHAQAHTLPLAILAALLSALKEVR